MLQNNISARYDKRQSFIDKSAENGNLTSATYVGMKNN